MPGQKVPLGGSTYTFTTDEQDLTRHLRILGTVYDNHGEFYGLVVQEAGNPYRWIFSTKTQCWTNTEERRALVGLDVPGAGPCKA